MPLVKLAWVPFVVEDDEALDPMDVRLLRPAAVAPGSEHAPDLVEQLGPLARFALVASGQGVGLRQAV